MSRPGQRTPFPALAALIALTAASGCGLGADDGSEPADGSVPARTAACAKPRGGTEIALVRRGARVRVHDSPGGEVIGRAGHWTEFGSRMSFSIAERHGCWAGVVSEIAGNGELGWVRLDPQRVRVISTPYSLRADLSERLLELRRGGRVLERILVTIGAPETATPTGRFAVTDQLTGRGLNPVYGCCAIALTARQPSLPPDWPGGDRIAIHGWDGIVGEASSNGCLRATNHDMRTLFGHIPLGTPVHVEA